MADLVLVNLNKPNTIRKDNILYKCGWSPMEGMTMPASIEKTFVNGHMVYGNGVFDESKWGARMEFRRD